MNNKRVEFYCDFVSPYSWLALERSSAFAAEHGVNWVMRPVVYGAILDAAGLVGPAEAAAKRRYTFFDVARLAARAGLRLTGPPRHPFRSLESLRTLTLYRDEPQAPELALQLARAAWSEGRDLEDLAVLQAAVEVAGLDAGSLAEGIRSTQVKQALRQATDDAIRGGVFGVPTFVHAGSLFWGQDRMEHLAEQLAGGFGDLQGTVDTILARPRGIDRAQALRQRRTEGSD